MKKFDYGALWINEKLMDYILCEMILCALIFTITRNSTFSKVENVVYENQRNCIFLDYKILEWLRVIR